jgi:hypothetical protein
VKVRLIIHGDNDSILTSKCRFVFLFHPACIPGTYYHSSYDPALQPIKLFPRNVYGVSNGHLYANWPKTTIGISKIIGSSIVEKMSDLAALAKLDNKRALSDMHDIFMEWCRLMMHVLQDAEQLPDALLGKSNTVAMRIASVFVKPTILPRKHPQEEVQSTTVPLASPLTALESAGSIICGSASMSTDAAFSGTMLASDTSIPTIDPSKPARLDDIFGTRTSTVLIHFQMQKRLQFDNKRCSVHPSADVVANDSGLSATVRNSADEGGIGANGDENDEPGCFMIMEKDFDMENNCWLTHTFTNLEDEKSRDL